MQGRSRGTFDQILRTVTPRNVLALEEKARTAFSLAVTYPKNESAFHAIESVVLRQLFRIMAGTPQMERETGVGFGGMRSFALFQGRINVVIPEKEKV